MLGAEEKPLTPRRPLPDLRAEQRFAEPVVTQEVIAASLHTPGDCASARFWNAKARACACWKRPSSAPTARWSASAIRTGAPLRDPDVMLRLLNQRLDALADPLDAGFGFDVIRLEASLAEKTHAAEASFDADENARWQIAFLVDRLSARFGEHRVQRFVPQDTHIPEAQSVAIPAQDRDFDGAWTRQAPATSIRRCGPCACWKSRKKSCVDRRRCPTDRRHVSAGGNAEFDVIRAEGPERIAHGMVEGKSAPAPDSGSEQNADKAWRGAKAVPPSRDYFRVETRQGLRFWLYRDGQYRHNGFAPRWYMHGVFA